MSRICDVEEKRWICLLQKLDEEYLVTEEDLSGRTTVFADPSMKI